MARGIACPGIGNNLIKLKKYDPVNYVRQGALISSALILIQWRGAIGSYAAKLCSGGKETWWKRCQQTHDRRQQQWKQSILYLIHI